MLFKFDEAETARLVAAFRATRKVQDKPTPTIAECLRLAAQAERVIILGAALDRCLRGEAMIDLTNDVVTIIVPQPEGQPDLMLSWQLQPEAAAPTSRLH